MTEDGNVGWIAAELANVLLYPMQSSDCFGQLGCFLHAREKRKQTSQFVKTAGAKSVRNKKENITKSNYFKRERRRNKKESKKQFCKRREQRIGLFLSLI